SGLRIDLKRTLIGEKKKPENISPSENDKNVEGTYRMARGIYTSPLKLLPIIGPSDVTVHQNEDGGIMLQSAQDPEPMHYVETDDLTYERVDDTIPLIDKAGMDTSHVQFQLDGQGHVTKMTYGTISDFLPVPFKDRIDVNIVIIIVSVLTFISYTIGAFVQWIIRKRHGNRLNMFPTTGLLASIGCIITINIIVLFVRFMMNPFRDMASLNIHLWVNMLLPITLIVCGYFTFKQWKKKRWPQNGTRLFLLITCFIFMLFLLNFNLYSFTLLDILPR